MIEGFAPPSFSPFLSRIRAGIFGLCFVGGSGGRWRSRLLARAGNIRLCNFYYYPRLWAQLNEFSWVLAIIDFLSDKEVLLKVFHHWG